ncbi:MAG: septum site-determining protein MinC [Kofleriaceae bacterium]
MSQAPSVAFAVVDGDSLVAAPALVSLKGTTRGLEILISSAPSAEALGARLTELLAEAPSFFAGSDARVAFEGALPVGALGCLEAVATRFELKIVELGPVVAKRARTYAAVIRRDDAPRGKLAEGTGPIAEAASEHRASAHAELPSLPSASLVIAAAIEAALSEAVAVEAVAVEAVAVEAAAAAAESAGVEAAAVEAAALEAALPEATPIEVALANTAPYSIVDLLDAPSGRARADAAEPSSSEAVALDDAAPTRNAAAIEAAVAHAVDAVTIIAESEESWGLLAAAAETISLPPTAPPAPDPAVIQAAAELLAAELVAKMPPGPRLVIGPVRSGVIVDHPGHVIIIGDVNPGAQVRAEGSILVLGRLRGVAHAAIGRDAGFIVALTLSPQQLRIGRMVARAGDADRPSGGAEIAYVTGEAIVVERFIGRLPSGLAASM